MSERIEVGESGVRPLEGIEIFPDALNGKIHMRLLGTGLTVNLSITDATVISDNMSKAIEALKDAAYDGTKRLGLIKRFPPVVLRAKSQVRANPGG
jgi:hypothetical protein